MTKEEIKSLVAAKIAGQGTNVDAASVLPSIIEGILDLIPEAPVQADLTVTDPTNSAYVKMPEVTNSSEQVEISDEFFEMCRKVGLIRIKDSNLILPRLTYYDEDVWSQFTAMVSGALQFVFLDSCGIAQGEVNFASAILFFTKDTKCYYVGVDV